MKKLLIIIAFNLCTSLCFAANLRLGIIDSQNSEPYYSIRQHLIQELSRIGYEKGRNLTIKAYSIGNRPGTIKNIWKYNLKGKIDILYVSGTMATIGVKNYIDQSNLPIIFAAPTDPVGIGVVKNLYSKPSGNYTGVPYQVKVERRLDLIRKVFAKVKKIALIYADMPQSISYNTWLKKELKKKKYSDLRVIFKRVEFIQSERGQERMAKIARNIAIDLNDEVDLFLTPSDQMGTQRPYITELFEVVTKPIVGIAAKDIEEDWGSVLSISPSLKDIAFKSAHMIKRIANGEGVRDIIPQLPNEVIKINGKRAKELGLDIPSELSQYIVQ